MNAVAAGGSRRSSQAAVPVLAVLSFCAMERAQGEPPAPDGDDGTADETAMSAPAPPLHDAHPTFRPPRIEVQASIHGHAPAVDVGLHWRYAWPNQQRVDITAWRRVTPAPDAWALVQAREPAYGARVEMKLAPARSGLVADYRFLGLQLQGGARIGLRKKEGRPTLYYRTQF